MTVSTAYSVLSYAGNGATTAFSVTWPFFEANDLVVTLVTSTGVETVQTLTTHFTVSGGTDANGLPATGTVTMLTPPASGETLLIQRATDKTQATTFATNGRFNEKAAEAAFDKLTLLIQEGFGAGGSLLDGRTGDVLSLITSGATDYWDGESYIIRNVVNGTDDNDVVTVGQLNDAVFGEAFTSLNITDHIDFTELGAGFPDSPDANKARLHARDDGGRTVVAYKDAAGVVRQLASEDDVVWPVADLAALRGLDQDRRTTALVKDPEFDCLFRWDGSDLSSDLVVSSVTTTSISGNNCTATAHGLRTGHGVVVTTAVNGLSTNTLYYVRRVDADTFYLATTKANAVAGTAITLTGTTNFTAQRLLDPDQYTYVIRSADSLDGSDGAWVRIGGDSTSKGWSNSIPPARMERINDRLLVGPGATNWTGEIVSSGGTGSWLMEEGDGTTTMAYLLVNALGAFVTEGEIDNAPYGILGASKTPTGTNSQGAIGVAGYASGHATAGSSLAWAGYFDAVKKAGANTTTEGVEIEITNLNATPVAAYTPYSSYAQGRTFGLLIGSGADTTVNPTSYDVDVGLAFFNNGAKFRSGIVFRQEALTKDSGTDKQHAILLPIDAQIEWYHSDDITAAGRGFSLGSEVTSATYRQTLQAQDGGLFHYGPNGNIMFNVQFNASSVNYVVAQTSTTGSAVAVTAGGGDASVDMAVRSRSTGSVRLQTGGGTVNGLRVAHTASGVNNVYVQSGTTGNAATLGAEGSDTNVDLTVTGQGTGRVVIPRGSGGHIVGQSAVASAHTGDTAKTTLATIAIPAGAMGPNGQIEVMATFTYTNSANTKTLRVDFDGTTFVENIATTTASATLLSRIANRNSASLQVTGPTTGGLGAGTGTGGMTKNTANALNITISGQLANAGETITLESYSVRVTYGA